jgi:alpha-tubulin suppressor-like RCC1 family protein/uncharacterized membrane protein YgcG
MLRLPAGAYLVAASPVRGGLGSYYATLPRVRIRVRTGHVAAVTVSYATLIRKGTLVVAASETTALTGEPSGARVLTLRGSAAAAVKVGQFLASGTSAAAPYGYLVKVVTIHRSGRAAVLGVEDATLLQAVPSGEIDTEQTLEPTAGPASLAGHAALTVERFRAAPRSAHTAGFSLHLSNLTCSTSAGLHITPTVSFSPLLAFHAHWGFFKLDSASFTATASEKISLGASADAGASCSTHSPGIGLLPHAIDLPPFDIQVGPIPVVVTPTLQLYLSGSASVTAKLSASVEQESKATVGASYEHGAFTPISSFTHRFGQSLTAEGNAGAEVALSPTVDMLIYGVAGPSFDIGAAAKISADTNSTPWWALKGCVQAGLGFVISPLDLNWSDPHLIQYCQTLLTATSGPPTGGGGGSGGGSGGGAGGSGGGAGGGGAGGGGAGVLPSGTIAAGDYHTCALLAGGSIDCWGLNASGQLGDGTTEIRRTPVAVSGITNAIAITAGDYHTCALLAGGSIDCWGDNNNGQLGDGTTEYYRVTPVAVSGITNAIAITAGSQHTCALLAGGSIDCWGWNAYGQLGDGTTEIRRTPVAVSGITNAIAITAGDFHTCALLAGGSIDCWGENNSGQLGDGTTEIRRTPVAVSGITNATAITAGSAHTCALLAGGSIDCWGNNYDGQLGDGSQEGRGNPFAVSGITNATAITAGYAHTCALLAGGSIDCWGNNYDGQLGDGTQEGRANPVAVSAITNATAITAGEYHTCALLAGGSIDCWGDNYDGQLGDGTQENRRTPVAVRAITNAG